MIRFHNRGHIQVRAALFALGLMSSATALSTSAIAAPAAPKVTLSKTVQPLYQNLSKAIAAAKVRPDVVAARSNVVTAQAALDQSRGAARTQAQANLDGALAVLRGLVTPEKTQLDALYAAAATPDDKYGVGTLAIGLGDLIKDTRVQRRGLEAMLSSGKVVAADAPRLQYYLGQFAYEQKDFATSRTALQAAITGGFHENDIDGLLAEAYLADNQVPQGLGVLKQAIAARNLTATKAPAAWYRRGLGAAYKAKLLDQATDFAISLVKAYPTADNWAGAITVVREIGHFPAQETLDLMRLMGRTNSYAEERDYIEYIQAADARRLPGEVLKIIDTGLASGKLRASDAFIAEARTIANGRIAADRASLVGLERDARAPGASAATVSGAADAFLSYGDAAKAEALMTSALSKPGAERDRLLTRLGIAQLDQGNYAGAQANFAKVGGSRKYIAQLWAIYAAQKAAPAS